MSHFVAYILQFQEIIVYKIPPGGGGGSIASLRSNTNNLVRTIQTHLSHISIIHFNLPLHHLVHPTPGSGSG